MLPAARAAIRATAAVLAVMALPSAALAQSTVVGTSKYIPDAGPVLSGGTVIWAGEDDHGNVTVYRGDGTSVPAVLSTVRRTDRSQVAGVDLVASPDLVLAAARQTYACPDGCRYETGHVPGSFAQPLAGPAAGPLTALAGRCDDVQDRQTLRPYGLAVSGTVVVYRQPNCDRLAVRDLADPAAPPFELPAGAYDAQVAGRYVAYRIGPPLRVPLADRRDPIAVVDRTSNSELYRVDNAAGNLLSVDTHGTIALGNLRTSGAIFVASPDAPRPRTIYTSATAGTTRFSDGTIGVGSDAGDIKRLDLTDGTLHPPSLPLDLDYVTRVDTSGDQATWVQRTCAGFEIHLASLAQVPTKVPPAARCPLRLERPLKVSRKRILIRPSCAGFERRCIIDTCAIKLRLVLSSRTVVATAGGCDFDGPRQVRARLTTAGAELLRHRHRLRVELRLRLVGGGNRTEPVRRATFTLHR